MLLKFVSFILNICITVWYIEFCSAQYTDRYRLLSEKQVIVIGKVDKSQLQTFCYSGSNRSLWKLFVTVKLHLKINGDDFEIYKGNNISIIIQQHEESKMSWIPVIAWRPHIIQLDPFSFTCIGVVTKLPYTAELTVQLCNWWYIAQCIFGIYLFFTAKTLIQNVVVYYSLGTSVGILASVLILIFIKIVGYTILIGGWSVVFFAIKETAENLIALITKYWQWSLGYFFVTALLSFAFIYRYQPARHPRSIQLLNWCLQCIGLSLIYFSSYFWEVTLFGVILLLALYSSFPIWFSSVRFRWYPQYFITPRRLLSEEEYIEEGRKETRKALQELKKYCNSPLCDNWNIVVKLKDPKRQ